jgi:hypothetical protein
MECRTRRLLLKDPRGTGVVDVGGGRRRIDGRQYRFLDSRAGQVKLAFCSNVGRAPTPEPGDAEREVLTGCLPDEMNNEY